MCLYAAELNAKVTVSVPYIQTQKCMFFKYIFATMPFIPPNPIPFQDHENILVEWRYKEVGEMPHYLMKAWNQEVTPEPIYMPWSYVV